MSQIGSFALLLALALSAYSFLAGVFALIRQVLNRSGWAKPRGAQESRPSLPFFSRRWSW